MKESNLDLKRLYDSLYSPEQTELLRKLAAKHNISFTEIQKFLASIGRYANQVVKNNEIFHIQRFGKFIPKATHKTKEEKYGRNKNKQEEDNDNV